MTPDDPRGTQTPPSGVPRSPDTGPTPRSRPNTWFGDGAGPVWRFLGRWAFPLFIVFIAILARAVLLPFVFAGLIAYILSPIVRRMSERENGTKRMPRGLAIIICYIIFIAGITGFMFLLVPRLSHEIARLGKFVDPRL